MCTEWLRLPSGTFTFVVKFCRQLKMIEPEKNDEILDSCGKLTKSFKFYYYFIIFNKKIFRVMLMNLFDMFDLDNDGLLNREEFELYSLMSGSGKILNEVNCFNIKK